VYIIYTYIQTYIQTYRHTDMHACMHACRHTDIHITKGSLGYLSSMYFSTSLVLGEVVGPFPEIKSRAESKGALPPHSIPPWPAAKKRMSLEIGDHER